MYLYFVIKIKHITFETKCESIINQLLIINNTVVLSSGYSKYSVHAKNNSLRQLYDNRV